MKVAIYCRVSTSYQSCLRQKHDLTNYAKENNYEIVGTWQEVVSGVSPKMTERSKLLELSKEGKIDAILVTELSRWGRNSSDLIETLNNLSKWGVSFICLTGMQFDIKTPEGAIIAKTLASFVEFEREMTRERVKSGLALAKSKGKRLGRKIGQRPKSDKLTVPVVRMVKDGYSYRRIASELKLSKTTVVEIIKRQRRTNPNFITPDFKPTQLTLFSCPIGPPNTFIDL